MAGDMFGEGRLAMPFDITKRAILLDPPDELMPSVKAIVLKITVDEHIMTGLSYLIKYLGLHREQYGGFLASELVVASSMERNVFS